MTFVEACRAWKAVTGSLPIPVTVLLEGEEESGGVNLPPFLDAHADELRADVALICDTNMWDAATPAVTTSLRGMVTEEIIIHAADRDLHSGFYGWLRPTRTTSSWRFWPACGTPTAGSRCRVSMTACRNFPKRSAPPGTSSTSTPRRSLREVSLSVPAGETGRSVLEQTWARPTCEINGMGGGYQGEGFKTVIPAVASAKVSFRLVFDQDPEKIRESFRAYVSSHVPADCGVEFIGHGSGMAVAFDTEGGHFQSVKRALSDEWGREAAFIGGGGSIPVTLEIKEKLGMDAVMAGFGLNDDRIHSPNENTTSGRSRRASAPGRGSWTPWRVDLTAKAEKRDCTGAMLDSGISGREPREKYDPHEVACM